MVNSENVMIASSPTGLNISKKGGDCLDLGLFFMDQVVVKFIVERR
jgi:hypothetical protein